MPNADIIFSARLRLCVCLFVCLSVFSINLLACFFVCASKLQDMSEGTTGWGGNVSNTLVFLIPGMNVLVLVLVQINDNTNQIFYGGCNFHKVNDKSYTKN